MIGAPEICNGSHKRFVVRRLGLAVINMQTKFEVSIAYAVAEISQGD